MRSVPPSVRRLLERLAASDVARPVDLALARLLAALDAGAPDATEPRARAVALTAALASVSRREGHSAVVLADHAGRPFPGEELDLPRLPALDAWHAALAATPVAGPPKAQRPLVVENGRVALARFWHAERRLAASLASRLAPDDEPLAEPVRALFRRLFPDASAGDRQADAALAALQRRVVLVAGGPGTGKTTTAARLLALLLAREPDLRIALAAPTGKAAQRLRESLDAQRHRLPDGLGERLPADATTLHRLLGLRPDGTAAYDARRPLPADVVLVDEGSMVDLPLFDALVAALPARARLVVLGDPDQLASVEAGAVFADLVAAGAAGPMAGSVVTLTHSHRFGADSEVGRLAVALREGTPPPLASTPAAEALGWVVPHARAVVASGSPEEALARLGTRQLLAVVRRGPRGVEGLNAAVEAVLQAEGAARWNPWQEPFYPGRPLLVTQNDPDVGLSNGDVGVGWVEGGRRVVCFPDASGAARRVPLHRMPAHEPAWAVTVHKSQGSEYDDVGLVLPEPGSRGAGMVGRELLYTAITRARERVAVFGEGATLAAGAARRSERHGGLRERLAEQLAARESEGHSARHGQ